MNEKVTEAIWVTKTTREKLKSLGTYGDTMDKIINKLINNYNEVN